jgi:outer membrane protein assembly factor BamB
MAALKTNRALITILALAAPLFAGDWPTFGHDPARSGWAPDEKTITAENVSNLRLQWATKLKNQSYSLSALTAPVAMTNIATSSGPRSVVYVAGISGSVFALDAESGEPLWTRSLKSMATARKAGLQGTFLCPNGITATPVLDRQTNALYVIAPDGALYGLDLGNGKIVYGPVPFVAPFAKSWSLNLVDGIVYTTVSLGCGNGRSGVYAADIRNPRQPSVRQLFLSNAYTAGIWGRGGAVIGENGKLYGGTADGDADPTTGDYSNMVIAASLKELSVSDYFTPPNLAYLKKKDLDVGSASPVWFSWRNRNLLADGFKEGLVYLFDADRLGAHDHGTPLFKSRLGNDNAECCAASGIWGGLSASRDDRGNTWVFVPLGGPLSKEAPRFPISNGSNPHGSILAFQVVADLKNGAPVLQPAWTSGDFQFPDPVVIANGVVFALSNGENPDQRGDEPKRFLNTRPAVLKALDANTGRELFNSGSAMKTWVHFSGLAIADGRVFAVDHDSNVYSFGLRAPRTVTELRRPVVARGPDQLGTSWIGRAERQDEYLRSWVIRAGASAGLVLVLAAGGLLFGVADRNSSRG